MQEMMTGQTEPDLRIIRSVDFYGEERSEVFGKLIPYAKTPPRPIFSKETQQSILKEVPHSSTEYNLISAILGKVI